MVWGGICVHSRTELLVLNGTLTGQRYINEVLQPVVLPFVQQHHIVLQDDNARPHRARIVQQFLQQNNVDHLDWPALNWSGDQIHINLLIYVHFLVPKNFHIKFGYKWPSSF